MSAKYLNQANVNQQIQLRCWTQRVDGGLFVVDKCEKEISGHVANQTVSITEPVLINGYYGIINTQTATAAGVGNQKFTVNNNKITANSILRADVHNYSGTLGTNGYPSVQMWYVSPGVADMMILNKHGGNALNGNLGIFFEIIEGF